MRAVVVTEPGGPENLVVRQVADPPPPGAGELTLDVVATAVNRADLLQREGRYPPPPGASQVLGMECSATIAAVGPDVTGWVPGDACVALLAGGGYAEKVVVPAGQVVPQPHGVSLLDAAALPEAAATVWSNLMMLAHLRGGETLLVHGGAGGIGTHAIQVAAALGARVLTTAGSAAKLERCAELGAAVGINYRSEDFVEAVHEATEGRGVDVILDNIGAAYLARNVAALAPSGRLVVIGLQGGARGELDLAALMAKRGALLATTLRARPVAEKSAIMAAVAAHVWPLVAEGSVRPVIDRVLPLEEVAQAHRLVEASDHVGKVVLAVGGHIRSPQSDT